MMKSILITTGDSDGIGLEITRKALTKIRPSRNFRFIVVQSNQVRKALPGPAFSTLSEAFSQNPKIGKILTVQSSEDPATWVKNATHWCLKHPDCALVTGPLSKQTMREYGHTELGHTEIFKKITKSKFLFQTYLGSKFNVLLVTDHLPLKQVPSALVANSRLEHALQAAKSLVLDFRLKKKIAVLGLNPHAGEGGLIGSEDQWVLEVIKKLDPKHMLFEGPLPADSAFEERKAKSLGLYVALYHDQGLIPFKTVHGFDEGVHLTLGIPFVRTSVDHGTAKHLYGKGVANSGSMRHALQVAIQLMRSK